jgi:UDP-2,3-diacylglucosamine hydrolase
MATYFVSDLHLSVEKPHLSELFLRFLNGKAKEAEALYILGDLFEVWVGDDNRDPHNDCIIAALAEFSNTGIPLYFMHGNRDFLIGEQFIQKTSCLLLSDPTIVELYGARVLVTHGDCLCILDRSYQIFRNIVRRPLIQKLFLSFPLSWRQAIANLLRENSSPNLATNTQLRKWDVTAKAVYQMLRNHQSLTLIHGHTHKPGIHDFILDNQPAKRIVLGDWGKTGNVLIYSPDHCELKTVL